MECQSFLGDPCVSYLWICDETEDCLDGVDEQSCVQGVPKHCFFTCRNDVTCLPTRQLGDGHQDCPDGEDERISDIEDALRRRWGSCSNNCSSVHGNASCVPDAFSCDGDADCLEKEDEQDCEIDASDETEQDTDRGTELCSTFTCHFAGIADPICLPSHQICDGYPDCALGEDEQGCGHADGLSTQTTNNQEPHDGPTAEPTAQGSFEDQTAEGSNENHGSKGHAMGWMVAAAMGGQILYRLAF
ncbi:very low-density lipoprotein receptor-like [Branchiostoma floridae]|uniref:Very low-density lipoprotein receptor-like n=1 Tax=Branchiostoma floridae TaxID=7739 RepID=A0A9J7LKV1_BRAFL|nr:very low-density lipoprotein receptor-like [Branchiostoma floridae]